MSNTAIHVRELWEATEEWIQALIENEDKLITIQRKSIDRWSTENCLEEIDNDHLLLHRAADGDSRDQRQRSARTIQEQAWSIHIPNPSVSRNNDVIIWTPFL